MLCVYNYKAGKIKYNLYIIATICCQSISPLSLYIYIQLKRLLCLINYNTIFHYHILTVISVIDTFWCYNIFIINSNKVNKLQSILSGPIININDNIIYYYRLNINMHVYYIDY